MGFWKTFVVTVAGGVVVGLMLKALDSYASDFPSWLGWLGSSATWLWAKLWTPMAVPLAYALIFIVFFAQFVFLHAARCKEVIDLNKKLYPEQPKVSKDELEVLDALIHADTRLEMDVLLNITGLSRVRLGHAVDELRLKGFVRSDFEDVVSLEYPGRKYVVDNNLDR